MKQTIAKKSNVKFNTKYSVAKYIAWLERLGMLLGAGVSLADSLRLMKDELSQAVLVMVERGGSLSDALNYYQAPNNLVFLVRAGEVSGSLAAAIQQALQHLVAGQKTKQLIVSALTYPFLICVATTGIAVFLVGYIFPKIMPLFISMHIVLPLPTQILLFVSNFVAMYWLEALLGAVFLCVSSWCLYKYVWQVRKWTQNILLRLFVVRQIMRDATCIQIFELLQMQLSQGVFLSDAVGQVIDSQTLYCARDMLYRARDAVLEGKSFAQSLSIKQKIISDDYVSLLVIAEQTGNISETCAHIASISKANLERTIERMTRLIEPALMLGVGVLVGGIALSIIMPIYEITNQLNVH